MPIDKKDLACLTIAIQMNLLYKGILNNHKIKSSQNSNTAQLWEKSAFGTHGNTDNLPINCHVTSNIFI